MADVILTTNTTTNQTITDALDVYFLGEGVLHSSTSATSALILAGTADDRYVNVNGTMLDVGSSTITDSTVFEGVGIFVSQTGKIQTTAQYRAIDLDSDLVNITNFGEIVGGEAIRLDGVDNEIYNAGLIGGLFGTSNSSIETIIMNGLDNRLINAGTIIGESAVNFGEGGFVLNNTGEIIAQLFGIESDFGVTGTTEITNSGSITVVDGVSFKGSRGNDFFENSGIVTGEMNFERGFDTLRNAGTIQGFVEMGDSLDTGADEVINSGTISGDVAFSTATVVSTVRNSGLIDGDIFLNAGNDLYVASGTGLVTGEVKGSFGNDTLVGGALDDRLDGGDEDDSISGGAGDDSLTGGDDQDTIAGGSGDDTILGESGNDSLRGGSGDDEMDGGSGADEIYGNGGNDDIFGDIGNDTIYGNSGDDEINGAGGIDIIYAGSNNDIVSGGDDNDFLFGGIGDDAIFGNNNDDILRGEAGDDTLTGGGGGDKLFGGAGADLIIGGSGRDVMRGNAGADTFIYLTSTDSTTAAADRIRDFEQGLDRIDISEVEDFVFVGDSAFSGTQAEVRFQTTSSGLRFEMDVDGNGTVDMRVNMNNVSTLTQDDFIL